MHDYSPTFPVRCAATAPDVPAAEGGDQLRDEHEDEDCWHTPVQETQHP